MKFLFDLFPVVLFFIAFKIAGIYVATAVAIGASLLQVGWLKFRKQRVHPMLWASLAIIVVFGGATLFLQDETFIKWKPTVLYGAFAAALLISQFALGRNLIESMMGKQIKLAAPIWTRLSVAWALFFVFLGVLNIFIAYHYPTDIWVKFKLFGSFGLTLAFVVLQAIYLGRHVQQD